MTQAKFCYSCTGEGNGKTLLNILDPGNPVMRQSKTVLENEIARSKGTQLLGRMSTNGAATLIELKPERYIVANVNRGKCLLLTTHIMKYEVGKA